MRAKDVKAGADYLTMVGPALVRVTVVSVCAGRLNYATGREGPRRFMCKRVDNGTILPKPRTAAALREAPPEAPMYVARDGTGDVVVTGRSSKGVEHVAKFAADLRYLREGEARGFLELAAVEISVIDGKIVYGYRVMRGHEEAGTIHVSRAES